MIDKLEVPIESANPWSRQASELIAELRAPKPVIPFRRNRYYAAVIDLRDVMGIDAMLHLQGRGKGDSKLELLHSGEKSWDQIMSTIARVTDEHPEELGVRRLDLCANLCGVSIDWFTRSLRAQWKRKQWQYGEVTVCDSEGRQLDLMEISGRKVESIQLGMRPNPLRVYDKVAETRYRYEREKRRHYRAARQLAAADRGIGTAEDFSRSHQAELRAGAVIDFAGAADAIRRKEAKIRREQVREHLQSEFPFPSFEEWSGFAPGTILTRVERQIASHVPPALAKVRDLRKNLVEFNPFERLRFPGADTLIDVDVLTRDYSPVEILAGLKMMELLRTGEMTYHELYQFLNLKRNGRTYERKYAKFLAAAACVDQGISGEQLYERYRESVSRQLAA